MRCLVTGATGYVGGRLVPELLNAGHTVRLMVRDPAKVAGRPWASAVEVATADARDPAAVIEAMAGVDVAYYLLHSMGSDRDFASAEQVMAEVFVDAARRQGVRRIVYLGGMVPDEQLSEHLRSRAEVGEVFLRSPVPTVVLRAGVVIGSGSASFEMLRYLTERLPVMVVPRWVVHSRVQPIAIRDVLHYLVAWATVPAEVNRAFDIGGPDVLTYLEMMQAHARVAGLPRRRIVPVPVLSPSLSSHWVGLVTPVPRGIARPLVESLRNTAVASERDINTVVPAPAGGLTGFEEAVTLALSRVQNLDVPTRWSSASTPGAPSEPLPSDPGWTGGSLYLDERERAVHATPEQLWRTIEGIGGQRGWYSFSAGWRIRGLVDRLVGGPGLRRGRRDPDRLLPGDSLDWWRVEHIEPGRALRLRAEMRLPGLAWLELEVCRDSSGRTMLRQRALFHPHGAAGHLYWAAVYPFHGLVFSAMQRNIARAAEATGQTTGGAGADR